MNNQTDSSPATKRDLKILKDELSVRIDSVEKKLGVRIEKLESGVETLAIQVAKHDANFSALRSELNEKFDMILQWFDTVSAQFSNYKTEKAAAEHTFLRHEKRLDEHDARLSKLEVKTG